jgi:hypothetical protein
MASHGMSTFKNEKREEKEKQKMRNGDWRHG